MNILDPVLGGKIRAFIMTLFTTFVAVSAFVEWTAYSWYETVVTVVGAVLIVIEGLTHGTEIGDVTV